MEPHMKFIMIMALTIMLPFAAYAQDEHARVDILKAQIEGFLENQKSVALKNGCKLDTKGAVTVEKAPDGYFAFTLPHITYTDAKGVRTEIGMIALNAVPRDNYEWSVSLALPTPIKSFSSGGGEFIRTVLGKQKASGIWNERLAHFTSIDALYENVQVSNLRDQSTATIGALSVDSNLTEQGEGAFTGKAVVSADNISAFDAETTFRGLLPRVVVTSSVSERAAPAPMTKDQVKNRAVTGGYPDAYALLSFLTGTPDEARVVVTGLDTLNSQMQQAVVTANPSQRAELLPYILGVGALSGIGRADPANTQTKTYDIVFGDKGAIMINGTDFGSLLSTSTQPAAGLPILQ
jgi:hypothetical protein